MAKLAKTIFTLLLSLAATATSLPAQTLTTLVTFDGRNGITPSYGTLVQGTNGNFYGTTESGGDETTYCSNGEGYGCGTVFEVTPDGVLTTVHAFCSETNCADGIGPEGGLVLASNGSFYGTTGFGGTNGGGTIFEIAPDGKFATLYSFCSQADCADGSFPYTALVQASNGDLYGTTSSGGSHGFGTIFRITLTGTLTTVYDFCSQANCADGEQVTNPLIEARNGKLYGVAPYGGANGAGTVFHITLSGSFEIIHSFDFKDGAYPYGALLQATNGNFYGTTAGGGRSNGGTIFELSPSGALKTLYQFCMTAYCADGDGPYGGLIEGQNENFYGTTAGGGAHFNGTIFEVSPAGKLMTLYSFCSKANCADGEEPLTGLAQSAEGTLYGTTQDGGDADCSLPYGCGTVFSLEP